MDGVILGMPGPWAESNYEAADIYTTKIGGVPDWPFPVVDEKPDLLECSECRSHLSLLAQVYAPVSSKSLSIDERVIYVFGCMVLNCKSPIWRALRVQIVVSNKAVESPEPSPSSSKKNWLEDLCSFDNGEEDDDIDLEELGRALSEASLMSPQNNVTKSAKKLPAVGQSTRSIDGSIPVLPCFYIYTQEEKLLRKATPESSELQTAIKEYEKNHEDDSNGESYDEEKYEYDSTLHADRTYLKFKKRMDAYPEQCFRYSYGGKPLLASGKTTIPESCNLCGGARHFEMQLMPTLIYFLQEGADDQQRMSLEKLDWLTMLVYICSMEQFSVIDAKHDHVMEMLANIQEQLRVLEMNRRKGSRVDFGVANAQPQIQFSSLDQSPKPAPKGENEGISNIEVVTGSATISKSSNDTKLENEEDVELLKYVPSIVTVAMEAYYSTTKATEIQEQRVFDEMPESEKSKISDILPPLVLGSEIDEVYDFSVSNSQFQMPLERLSLISSPSSFGFSLDDTKLEDEGLVDVPIHTSVAELQLQESKSEFERLENFPDLSLPKFIPSWRIMVSSLLHLPSLYKCYGVEALTKEELIWLDTGQYLMVSGLSREGVTSNFTGSWNLMALQSGLKSELAWALNALTFISFKEEDEVPKDAPSLAMNLGLLDALLKVIGDWLNIALLIVLAKTPRVRLLGANAVVTGFGSEYESINIGDSVSYHIVGSGGYSNDNPCSQKNIAKPCSSVWWFEGDGLLNLDEERGAGKQQCAAAVSNIIRSFSFMVENKIAMGHNRHCLETMFHCLQDYVTKDEEQLVTNFEFGLFVQEVVENDCQIFEANFQVKAATKYSLEPDLTKENQRISSRLELEDDFLVATIFEAYGCKDKLFDRPPLKPPFQCRHGIESWGQDSFKRGVLSRN